MPIDRVRNDGTVFRKKLNAKRPKGSSGPPPPPVYGLTVFNAVTLVPAEIVSGFALAERQLFETYLIPGYSIKTWEGELSGAQYMSATINLNGLSMNIPNPPALFPLPPGTYWNPVNTCIVTTVPESDRFNTTAGGNCYLNRVKTVATDVNGYQMTFDFPTPISGWGAYFTDLGDFGGAFTVRITRLDNTQFTYTLWNSTPDPAPPGTLTFFGFVDGVDVYKKIEFFCSAGANDVFSIDDMVILPLSMLKNP